MNDNFSCARRAFFSNLLRPSRSAMGLALAFLGFFAPGLAFAQAANGPVSDGGGPVPEEILYRAIARSEAQIEAGADGQFESMVLAVVQSMDGEGEVTDTESTLSKVYPLGGAVFEELVEKDGRPLTEKEAREARKEKEEFIQEVEKRKASGLPPQPEDERRVRFDRELMARYRIEMTGEEVVRGDPCWVLYFEPREGKLPEKTRMDKALNRSTGKMWVAKSDYGVPRVEFHLDEPIRYLGGFLATVRETAGRVEYERIEPGIWMPREFELKLDLRVLVKNIRRLITRQWSDYRRHDLEPGS